MNTYRSNYKYISLSVNIKDIIYILCIYMFLRCEDRLRAGLGSLLSALHKPETSPARRKPRF